MDLLTEQELHHIAMNHVGECLKDDGYEFIAINSQLKKHPQFVCVDATNALFFVMVKATKYPNNPAEYDTLFMETFVNHASKKKAKVMFAGVGIANASDLNLPITKQSEYIINYEGAKIIS